MNNSLRRRFRNDPTLNDPRDLEGLLNAIRVQTQPKRTSLYLHVASPERGLAVEGQTLPNLPGSAGPSSPRAARRLTHRFEPI